MFAESVVDKERIMVNRIVDGKLIEHRGQVACDECDWTWDITSDDIAEAVKAHDGRDGHAVTIQLTIQLFDDRRLTIGEARGMEADTLRRKRG